MKPQTVAACRRRSSLGESGAGVATMGHETMLSDGVSAGLVSRGTTCAAARCEARPNSESVASGDGIREEH